MNNVSLMGTGNWFNIISILLIVLCFSLTLNFFQHLKSGDEQRMEQSKKGAVISLALALLIPAIYNFYIFSKMMNQ